MKLITITQSWVPLKPCWVLLVASLLLFHRSGSKNRTVILTRGSCSQPVVVKFSRCSGGRLQVAKCVTCVSPGLAGGAESCMLVIWKGEVWVGGWRVSLLLVCLTSLSFPNSSSLPPCLYKLLSQWVAAVFWNHWYLEAKNWAESVTGTSFPSVFSSSFANFAFSEHPYSCTVSSLLNERNGSWKAEELYSFWSHRLELCENLSEITEL